MPTNTSLLFPLLFDYNTILYFGIFFKCLRFCLQNNHQCYYYQLSLTKCNLKKLYFMNLYKKIFVRIRLVSMHIKLSTIEIS